MGDFEWVPSPEQVEAANITRLMRACGFEIDPVDGQARKACARAFVRKSQRDGVWFWDRALGDMGLEWYRPYDRVLDVPRGSAFAEWFVGGRVNLVANCLDRHASSVLSGQPALIEELESGDTRRLTYAELAARVAAVARRLLAVGVMPGDRVAAHMPMVLEAVISMLATWKVGAVFAPIPWGYGVRALRARVAELQPKVVVTADCVFRGGKRFGLKQELDESLADNRSVESVFVVQREGRDGPRCALVLGRDQLYCDTPCDEDQEVATEQLPAMHTALMLFTSGASATPKVTVHSHGGCLAQAAKDLYYHFDMQRGDVCFWPAELSEMMGVWQVIGCLTHGATLVLFDHASERSASERIWAVLQRHGVTLFGGHALALRRLRFEAETKVENVSVESLRMSASTGAGWDLETHSWYFSKVGLERCPHLQVCGGTDLLGCLLAPLPILPIGPVGIQGPGLGLDVAVVDDTGQSQINTSGYLVCRQPAPSMTRGLWNEESQYVDTYWSRFPGMWYHGDWAQVDHEGRWFLHGRVLDTVELTGRRVSLGEIEALLNTQAGVQESAALGVDDPRLGPRLLCFVVLRAGVNESEGLRKRLSAALQGGVGPLGRPPAVRFVDDLPKTRNAKLLRRVMTHCLAGDLCAQDLSSVANPQALDAITNAR